jgi:hypothetical protein
MNVIEYVAGREMMPQLIKTNESDNETSHVKLLVELTLMKNIK